MVDLEQVSFIDSVGLAVLVGAAKRAAAHGGSLQLACALPKIRQLVRLTGLDCQIPLAAGVPGGYLDQPALLVGSAWEPAQAPLHISSGPGHR